MPEEQLKGSIKSNIKLKMYNGTYITQLGTCEVTIEFKNSKKCCVFFVVPGNGQVLLRMPDTAALNILNLNIDSIQAQVTNCRTNREQETQKSGGGLHKHKHSWNHQMKIQWSKPVNQVN